MNRRPPLGRKITNGIVTVISALAALIGIFFLGWILLEIFQRGATSLNAAFFTQLPTPPGIPGGGLANALVGTGLLTALAIALGVPMGVLAGMYLSEYGRHSRLGAVVRFTVNVMMGVPSIIVGLFAYGLLVRPFGHFSGFAGAVALAIIMLPVVARTSEDMLRLVPDSLRESALALGAPRWRTIVGVVLQAAKRGMITGTLLAVARVSGETAPLLFTALNSPYWPNSLFQPTANLTVTIFNYAMSPYVDWQQAAWGASLLITAAVLALTILARLGFMGVKK
ncbi:MAG: phosphate ABC transporter permease PstA [Myxococcales bacterium]|nr:phosphate ABC transporter permease PstA [Myxococcales bacterium]